MVFVWSNLCEGEPHYTLSQVALNDVIMVFAVRAAGRAAARRRLDRGALGDAAALGGALYRRARDRRAAWRRALLATGRRRLQRTLHVLQPVSLVALLTTLVLLFGFQGEQILAQPLVIVLLAVPILIQVYFNAGLAYWLSRRFGVAWCVAAPAALIGASNFFELAVAAAISLFGLNSGAALATVVGVLVEVPVMLSVVHIVKATRGWYESGARHRQQRSTSDSASHDRHDLPQPDLRHLAQHARDDPAERRGAEVIEYLKTPPSRERLVELITAMGMPAARAAAREGHALCGARARRPQMDRRRTDRLHAGAPDPDQPADRGDAEGRAAVPAVGDGAGDFAESGDRQVCEGGRRGYSSLQGVRQTPPGASLTPADPPLT